MNSLSLVVVIAVVCGVTAADYCTTPLGCDPHIGCNNTGKFASTCSSDAAMVTFTPALKALMADAHNVRRSYVASGADPKFDPACRMATIQWDDGLAAFAVPNVKQCQMKHDCHNTVAFKHSGQNLAWMGYFNAPNDETMLRSAVDMWYNEISNANMDYINSYPNNYQGPTIGHFTVMMADKNIRLGCAASTYSTSGVSYKTYLVACNYATTNIIGRPIYKSCSTAASACTTGTNPLYGSLCSTSEQIDPNNLS